MHVERASNPSCQPSIHCSAMRWIVDLVYILVILLTLPIWLTRMIRTGKIRTDWRGRCGHVPAALAGAADPGVSRVLIHAVSVGEERQSLG